jgi:hypothetical protein
LIVERPSAFFRGSELPRLLVLAVVMVAGWGLFLHFANRPPAPVEPALTAGDNPEPIVADHSVEFETVTDRTAVEFRDNAAYAMLLQRARGHSPAELAAVSRRDVLLPHLWQNPKLYRGVPIHLLGTALRILRYPSKLSETGWIYEASIVTPDAPTNPFVCVFEDAPKGLPIGPNVSERVVFNGYFLKIWKYQARDVARGAPLLVGRIGWEPRESSTANGNNGTLRWSLVAIGAMFVFSLARWMYQLVRAFRASPISPLLATSTPTEEINTEDLKAWVHSMGRDDDLTSDQDETDES